MARKLVWTVLLVAAVVGLVYLAKRGPEPWVIPLAVVAFFAAFDRRFGLLNRMLRRPLKRGLDLPMTNVAFPGTPLPGLEWIRTGQHFELRSGDATYATLQFDHAYFAVATTAGDRWTFDHKGWFSKSVVAVMSLSGAREGILGRPAGAGRVTGLWWSGNTWDTEGDWVVRYHNTSDFNTYKARVEIDPSILELPQLPLVVVLGWYLTHSKQVAARRAP